MLGSGGCRRRIIIGGEMPDEQQLAEPLTSVQEEHIEPTTQEALPEPTTQEPQTESMTTEPETEPPPETTSAEMPESTTRETPTQGSPPEDPTTTSPPEAPPVVMLAEQLEPDLETGTPIDILVEYAPNEGAGAGGTENIAAVEQENLEEPEDYITETLEADIGDDEEAAQADTGGALGIIDLYTNLLAEGRGALFECQRVYVYFELIEDYRTVNRSSAEHALIIGAGGYNLAERLRDDMLTVEDSWVIRRNPALIIKVVGADILGAGITDVSAAATMRDSLSARPGWDGVNAVIEGNILLISSQLLATDEGQLIAKLYIARAMYPTLFSDINISAFYQQLKDAGGTDFTDGIYAY